MFGRGRTRIDRLLRSSTITCCQLMAIRTISESSHRTILLTTIVIATGKLDSRLFLVKITSFRSVKTARIVRDPFGFPSRNYSSLYSLQCIPLSSLIPSCLGCNYNYEKIIFGIIIIHYPFSSIQPPFSFYVLIGCSLKSGWLDAPSILLATGCFPSVPIAIVL